MLAIVEESSVIYRYFFNSFVWTGYIMVGSSHASNVQSKGRNWVAESVALAYGILKVESMERSERQSQILFRHGVKLFKMTVSLFTSNLVRRAAPPSFLDVRQAYLDAGGGAGRKRVLSDLHGDGEASDQAAVRPCVLRNLHRAVARNEPNVPGVSKQTESQWRLDPWQWLTKQRVSVYLMCLSQQTDHTINHSCCIGFIVDEASSTMWLPSWSMSTSESTGISSSPG